MNNINNNNNNCRKCNIHHKHRYIRCIMNCLFFNIHEIFKPPVLFCITECKFIALAFFPKQNG